MNMWCEVYVNTLNENLKKVKTLSNKSVISVVKGNAYGLGISEVSKIIENDTEIFGVSTLEEANMITSNKDILIMTPVCEIPMKPKVNHIYTIDSLNDLKLFNSSEKYRVHIYLDTGMNRLGIKSKDVDKLITDIREKHNNINIEGIYTHLNDTINVEKTKKQISILKEVYDKYKDEIKWVHCLNSKGLLNKELRECTSFTNLVRAGNVLYGYIGENNGFKKAFQVRAKVVKRYTVKENGNIGYGSKFKIKKGTVVGVLPCGSIDKIGFKRDGKPDIIKDCLRTIKNSIKRRSYIDFKGRKLYELCEPNMNCTLIDITNINVNDNEEIIVNLNLSPIQADSCIKKQYI